MRRPSAELPPLYNSNILQYRGDKITCTHRLFDDNNDSESLCCQVALHSSCSAQWPCPVPAAGREAEARGCERVCVVAGPSGLPLRVAVALSVTCV